MYIVWFGLPLVGFMALAGVALPMGTFVPNLVLGAATGRLFGTLFDNMIQPDNTSGPLSNPGLYALCAAGAQLGGFTRVSLTVTSLLIEATGDHEEALPLYERVLRGRELTLGPKHADTVEVARGLHSVLAEMGVTEGVAMLEKKYDLV